MDYHTPVWGRSILSFNWTTVSCRRCHTWLKYENLVEKSRSETLSTAELVLLQKLDLAELHQFELARDLSIALLKRWLTRYKFKDWTETETRGLQVTQEMKEERASWIALQLNDQERWLTHGRGIDNADLTGRPVAEDHGLRCGP